MRSARGDSSLSLAVAGNLLIIYILWGSTYLAIRLALDTLPPFLSAATRFLIAGALMVGFLWLRGRFSNSPSAKLEPVRKEHWRSAAIIGGLLLFGGNGLVVQSEQYIDSGVAAVLIAAVPIWMNLLEALATRRRPSALVIAGVVAGFAGVVVLIAPVNGLAAINPLGVGLAVIAAMSWATGSIYSRSAPMPRSGLLGTGMEMLAGGAILVVAGIVTGELGRTHPAQFSPGTRRRDRDRQPLGEQ